jgi:hypothetical protein
MLSRFKRLKLQKKYIAFFGIIPLLFLTSLLQVKCPVCGGSGLLSSTPEMENVILNKFTTQQQTSITASGCAMYVMYLYNITASITNNNSVESKGYIEFDLKSTQNGRLLDTEYVSLQINGESEVQDQYSIWFNASTESVEQTYVQAEILNSAFPCKVCNGTGKVTLFAWLLANGLKSSEHALIQTNQQYVPPLYNPPDIEDQEAANND